LPGGGSSAIQAGGYSIFSLGTPFISTQKVVMDLYGPERLPEARTREEQLDCRGALAALVGAESSILKPWISSSGHRLSCY
jgi:hypothetical protein